MEILKGGWIKSGSVIAYCNDWQRPAKTEEWVCDTLIENKVYSKFVEFVCFPWATLVDAIERGKSERVDKLMRALNDLPPKTTLIRATACQHVNIENISLILKKNKVTNVFWAHKRKGDKDLEGMTLHPMALYPVAYFAQSVLPVKNFADRRYKTSFIGAYDHSNYISDERQKIFNLPANEESFILRRSEWHFEKRVYKEDINSINLTMEEERDEVEKMWLYKNVMNETQFAFCPSGAGPNTIRLWEAFMFRSIPVIINSNLHFPSVFFENSCVSLNDVTVAELNKLNQTSVRPMIVTINDLLSNVFDLFNRNSITKLIIGKK